MTIAVDVSSPSPVTSSGAPTTSAAFTPPSSCVIFAFCSADANNGSLDEALTVSDSATGTWNQAVFHNGNGGACSGIFWRLCPTSPGSITVSLTDNKGAVPKRLTVVVFTGTDQTNPIGATFAGITAAATYTSTVDQSWGWSCGLTANATLTAGGSGNTLNDTFAGFDSGDATFTLNRTAVTTPAGTGVTLTIAGTATIGHHVAVEILPPGAAAATPYAGPWTGPTPGRIGPTGQWAVQPLSSATAYTVAVAGSLTPAGAVTKAATAAKAGTITSSGALAKQAQKHPAGTLATAGAPAKQAAKALAGSLTPAGALTTIKVVLRSYAGSLTSSSTLAKAAAKGLSGGLTPAGSLAKSAHKTLAGTLTTGGGIAKTIGRHLVAALAAAGALNVSLSGQAARATSTPTVTDRRTSTTAVTARRTSTPEVEG